MENKNNKTTKLLRIPSFSIEMENGKYIVLAAGPCNTLDINDRGLCWLRDVKKKEKKKREMKEEEEEEKTT
ncbi:hypothetical protein OUZ56_011002 [Daphnia magna]|uniref:Uncharacterized protein n=1 Tax=Daphnia magna TaxID=35525 RepID=A0ABQ9YZ05_9CRUS|nr:hypothetical protein OUZ56_011002 [Daphnia magna]